MLYIELFFLLLCFNFLSWTTDKNYFAFGLHLISAHIVTVAQMAKALRRKKSGRKRSIEAKKKTSHMAPPCGLGGGMESVVDTVQFWLMIYILDAPV